MKFFALIDQHKSLYLTENKKVIPKDEFTTFLSAADLIEDIKKQNEEAGFQSGLEKWNEQLVTLEKEHKLARDEIANSIVPLAMTAVKRLIGKELKQNPETVIDIVSTALRP